MAFWTRDVTPSSYQALNLLGDCAILLGASVVAATTADPWHVHLLAAAAATFGAMLAWTLAGRVLRHYDAHNGRSLRDDLALTLVLLGGLAIPVLCAHALLPPVARSIDLARLFTVLVPGILWLRAMVCWIRRTWEKPAFNVLIVGVGPLGRLTGLDLRERAGAQALLGYLSFADEARHSRLPAQILGTAGELEEQLKAHMVGEVYIAGNAGTHHAEMQAAIRVCERFGTPFALPACGFRMDRAKPADAKAIADGYVHYLNVQNKPVQLLLKRLLDIAASGTALLLLSPLLAGVALAIKVTSRGPILFKQVRVGKHGRTFHMLKFRSMVANAEELKARLAAQNEQSGPVFKMTRDPRITDIGRFIRKYSIDELPQLINVLRGEMAIVGPRPPIPSEVAQYEGWQRRRLSVRPGLTCVWQVSGRNQISFEEWMYLDMRYIDHWSLKQDIALILKTVPVVLTGRGAS
jgi:exopolysaccharide biosynthesis polyprenyl glycosylphosphotransferase